MRNKKIEFAVWKNDGSTTPLFTIMAYSKTDAKNRALKRLGYGVTESVQQAQTAAGGVE